MYMAAADMDFPLLLYLYGSAVLSKSSRHPP
jgi:hypothetical protein